MGTQCIHDLVTRLIDRVTPDQVEVARGAGMVYDTWFRFKRHAQGASVHTLLRLCEQADATVFIIPNDIPIPAEFREYMVSECRKMEYGRAAKRKVAV